MRFFHRTLRHDLFWCSSGSAVCHKKGDPYLAGLPLDSTAPKLSSTLKSCINSGNRISPCLNTKYHSAKEVKNPNTPGSPNPPAKTPSQPQQQQNETNEQTKPQKTKGHKKTWQTKTKQKHPKQNNNNKTPPKLNRNNQTQKIQNHKENPQN